MYDPLMLALFLLHLTGLAVFWGALGRKWQLPWHDSVIVVPMLVWATAVFAAQIASACGFLGSLPFYALSTVLSAGLLGFIANVTARSIRPPLLTPAPAAFIRIQTPWKKKTLFIGLLVTLALFAAISWTLGFSVYPDNADSMIYRLPRAFWYVSNGSFMHPFEDTVDQRLVFYPLSGVSLYLPFVLYALPGTFHVLPSLLAWSGLLWITYRFGRRLGADRLWSLFAAWLVGLTPGILAQATSTNDEIIAAVALVAGAYGLWLWLTSGRAVYFLLAGLGVALSASTKLHIVFLLPILALALAVAALRHKMTFKDLRKIAQSIGPIPALTTIAVMTAIFTPFLVYNYLSTGRLYFLNNFQNDVFNLSANAHIFLQNLAIYFGQLVFSPIADLNVWPVANDRQDFNRAINALFDPLYRAILSDTPTFYHLGYRYQGITLPVSVRFVEFSLWSGFVWLLWPFQARGAATGAPRPMQDVFCTLALVPLLWLLLWSLTTLYMEGTATYYTFYLICAAPAAVFAFARMGSLRRDKLRRLAIGFVALTNLVIAWNLVMFSGFRALPDLYYARSWPYDWLLTEKPIINEIQNANRIRIAFTHEKMPYFGYMHWNPRAQYISPYQIAPEKTPANPDSILQLLPISSLSAYGYMPFKIENKQTLGLTYLGAVRAIGREVIFAAGNGVERRFPEQSNYIVARATLEPLPSGLQKLTYDEDMAGLNKGDHLTFEHSVQIGDKTVFTREAAPAPGFTTLLPSYDPKRYAATITTIARNEADGSIAAQATYRLGAGTAWLPDPGDY